MPTYSLFASADQVSLSERLSQAFADWVAFRNISPSRLRSKRALNDESREVYSEMWNAFTAFCAERSLDLHMLKAEDLELFLATRGTGPAPGHPQPRTKEVDLSARYARRFLTLINWVTTHEASTKGMALNTAARELLEQSVYKYANAGHKDPLPEFLTDAQAKRLIAFVTQPPDSSIGAVPSKWNNVRNRTAVAVMLGAGLTPGDVRNLTVDGVAFDGGRTAGVPWKLSLPGNGNFPGRETPLASWAGRQLAYWLDIRKEQGIQGTYVFPGKRNGGQWSDTRCYEVTREVLAQAGMPNDTGGVFRLRHTFALRQLARGKDAADVARWLGLLDINSMARYRRLLSAPVEVV
jgi:integrase